MSDNQTTYNPEHDVQFASLSPEDRHAYLMDTEPDYRSMSPQDKQEYSQYRVLQGAKANIANYPQQEENHWMGKLVPQAALPAMQKFTESAPIQASEKIGQAGARFGKQLGHDVVTGADVLTHPVESLAAAMPSPYGPKPAMRSMEETAREEHPIAYGAAGGIGEAVGGLADPRQLALVALSGGTETAFPVLSKIMSGAFGTQMGANTIEGAKDLYTNWDKYTPEQRAEIAARTGVDAYFTKEALGHTGVGVLGKVGETLKPFGSAMVRGAGHVAEAAMTPAALGGAAGAGVDYVGSKMGVPMHGTAEIAGGYLGKEIAKSAGRDPSEPLGRFPRMKNFGKEAPREGFVRQDKPIFGPPEPKVDAPTPQVEAPKVEAPVENKGLATLKAAYDKANSEYQKAYEAREAYRASMDQGIDPPVAVQKAFEKAEKAIDEAQFHYRTAEDAAARAKSGNADTGTIEPPAPKTPEGEILPPDDTSAEEIRRQLVPRKEMAGLYTQPAVEEAAPEAASQVSAEKPKAADTSQQVKRIGDLAQEGLGGKALEPNKPLKEQISVKKTEPKPVEEGHSKQQVHANGENLANAIPTTEEGRTLLQKFHDLSNVELRQLAISAGEDMGQQRIGRGKRSGDVTRPEMFDRLLKNHTPEELGRMMDEGKHLPPVSGGSQAATAPAREKVSGSKPKPITKNASGESDQSLENLNRVASNKAKGIKTYLVDSRSNIARPVLPADAADTQPGKWEHKIEIDKDGNETVVASGERARPRLKSARIMK